MFIIYSTKFYMKYIEPQRLYLALIFLLTFVASQQISIVNGSPKSKQFSGFELDNNISTVLIQKEVIRVSGVITDPKFYVGDQANTFMLEVNFTLKGDANVNFTCRDIYPLKNLKFDISCTLRKVGEFFVSLSATPSSQYEYKLSNYTKKYENTSNLIRKILPFQNFSFPTTVSRPAPKPEGFKLYLIDNNIQLKWTSQAPLTNATFFQINNKTNHLVKKQFLLSGNHQIFYPDFFEFRYFYPGKTIIEISHASSQDGTLSKISSPFTSEKMYISFNAMRHLKKPDSIGIYKMTPALPMKLKVGQKYNFTMIFFVRAKTTYYMMSLDQKNSYRVKYFRPKPDEEDEVKQKVPFPIQIVFDKPGTYLLSFQTINRQTILNQPIYVGEGIPFLPDYFDYYEYFFQNSFDSMLEIEQQYIARYLTDGKVYKDPGFDAPIQQQRAYLFDLLNYERRKYKAIPMMRDQKLEKMAQDHCQDMLDNNYYSSRNKKGEMPINRALRYNLTSFIDQYIKQSYSLGGLHLDTQKLGPMIDITSNKKLTRVGIGIVVDRTKYPLSYIVTYDFTIRDLILNPPDPVELQKFRQQIIKVMIEKNPKIRTENKNLSADISSWIKQNSEYTIEDLELFLDKKWSNRNQVKVWSREVFFYEDQLENIRDDQAFDNKEGTEIGLGLAVDKESKSTMSAFVVFI